MRTFARILGALFIGVEFGQAIYQYHLLSTVDTEGEILALGVKMLFNLIMAGIIVFVLCRGE